MQRSMAGAAALFLIGALVAIVLPVVVGVCLLPHGFGNASNGDSTIREFEQFAARGLLIQKITMSLAAIGGAISTTGVVYAIYTLGRLWLGEPARRTGSETPARS